MTPVYIIEGNYAQLLKDSDLGLTEPPIQADATLTLKRELDCIQKDIIRTPFISPQYESFTSYTERYIQEITSTLLHSQYTYVQGDLTGSLFTEMLLLKYLIQQNDFFTRECISFTYVNDLGNLSGFALTYVPECPQDWCMCFVENITATPDQRRVTLIAANKHILVGALPMIPEHVIEQYSKSFLIA